MFSGSGSDRKLTLNRLEHYNDTLEVANDWLRSHKSLDDQELKDTAEGAKAFYKIGKNLQRYGEESDELSEELARTEELFEELGKYADLYLER